MTSLNTRLVRVGLIAMMLMGPWTAWSAQEHAIVDGKRVPPLPAPGGNRDPADGWVAPPLDIGDGATAPKSAPTTEIRRPNGRESGQGEPPAR